MSTEFKPPLPGWVQDELLHTLASDMHEALGWIRAGLIGLVVWQAIELLGAIVETSKAGAVVHGVLCALWIWQVRSVSKRMRKYGRAAR